MIERVLVGTDGSPTASRAVARAVEVAAAAGATLTVLSVGKDGERVAKEAASEHEATGVTITSEGALGDPASALVEAAENGNFDLLVTGNKGLTGIQRLNPVGRVPGKVAHHLPCSLLVVKTT